MVGFAHTAAEFLGWSLIGLSIMSIVAGYVLHTRR